MSTRCNVIISDAYGARIMFYRHSDGYPSGVAPTLGEFLRLVQTNRLRDNAEQSAGWLIVLGYEEYSAGDYGNDLTKMRSNTEGTSMSGWKVGAYEPSVGLHGDIEYLYEIDVSAKTIKGWHHNGDTKGASVTKELRKEIDKTSIAA